MASATCVHCVSTRDVCGECNRQFFSSVPVVGTVGDGGKIDLTPGGEALLAGPNDDATRIEEYADALCESAERIKALVTPLPNHLACTGLVAAQDLITASIRLYGIATEMRNEL